MLRAREKEGEDKRYASVGDQEEANSEDGARGRLALVGDIGAKTRIKPLPDQVKQIR